MIAEGKVDVASRSRPDVIGMPAGVNRRSQVRYPIHCNLRFTAEVENGVAVAGVGRTLNISSRGMLLHTRSRLKPEGRISAEVDWPAAPGERAPLALLILGRVLRCDGSSVALRIVRHEFVPAPKKRSSRPSSE